MNDAIIESWVRSRDLDRFRQHYSNRIKLAALLNNIRRRKKTLYDLFYNPPIDTNPPKTNRLGTDAGSHIPPPQPSWLTAHHQFEKMMDETWASRANSTVG